EGLHRKRLRGAELEARAGRRREDRGGSREAASGAPMNWQALAGGALIGTAAAALLVLTGKTAGVSGIVDGALRREKGEWGWKVAFLLGLVAGGVILRFTMPETLASVAPRELPLIALGGLLVG